MELIAALDENGNVVATQSGLGKAIANDIEKHYKNFDAFVVLHGTDTMAYSASGIYLFHRSAILYKIL